MKSKMEYSAHKLPQALLESKSHLVILLDKAGGLLLGNSLFDNVFSKNGSIKSGTSVLDYVSSNDHVPLSKLLESFTSRKKGVSKIAVYHHTANKEVLQVDWEFSLLSSEQKNSPILGLGQVNSNHDLDKESNVFKEALNKLKSGILIQDDESKIIYSNEKASKLLGVSTKSLHGKNVTELKLNIINKKGEPLSLADLPSQKVLKSGNPVTEFVLGVLNPNTNERVWLEVSSSLFFESSNNQNRIIHVFEDVSALIEAKDKTLKIEDRLETMMDYAPMVIFMKDLEGQYLFFNKMYRDFMDRDLEPGMTDYDIFEKDFADWCRERDVEVTREDKILSFEHHVKDQIFFETKFPIKDRDGKVYALGGFSQNITEQKEKEEKLTQTLKEKKVLLAEVHHRVKNNLAIVTTLLELEGMQVTDLMKLPFQRSINRIHSIALVHELMYQAEDLSFINIKEYFEDLIPLIQRTMEPGDNVEVNNQLEDCTVNINQAIPLGLLVNELITNSFKYAFPENMEGVISINMKIEQDDLIFTYKDNGVGFKDATYFEKPTTFGMELVHSQLKQLGADFDVNLDNRFELIFRFKPKEKGAHGNI